MDPSTGVTPRNPWDARGGGGGSGAVGTAAHSKAARSWSAVAERSADTAFDQRTRLQGDGTVRPLRKRGGRLEQQTRRTASRSAALAPLPRNCPPNRDTLCLGLAPLQGTTGSGAAGGIAALNPRLMAANPPGWIGAGFGGNPTRTAHLTCHTFATHLRSSHTAWSEVRLRRSKTCLAAVSSLPFLAACHASLALMATYCSTLGSR